MENTMTKFNFNDKKIYTLDGAMGTEIHKMHVPESAWMDKHGCNELLNITAPEVIEEIHYKYLAAGADIIETNTFGILPWVLQDYDLDDRLEEIATDAVIVAQKAAQKEFTSDKPRYVAAIIGPGTKLASLHQISFDEMLMGYKRVVEVFIKTKVDMIILETSQDPLNIKAGLVACFESFKKMGVEIPVIVSVTMEASGTMLIGTDVETIVSILKPFPIVSLGFNCGVGPREIEHHIHKLSELWNRAISVHTNAGLPENVGGETIYHMSPSEFADLSYSLCKYPGVKIIGGCCGTNPDHIHVLSEKLKDAKYSVPVGSSISSAASLFSVAKLNQTPPPFFIGERANATGSKAFRQLLLTENYKDTLGVAQQQVRSGAHGLDVSVAYSGRDEVKDMKEVVSIFSQKTTLPLIIDSTQPRVIEEALKLIGGKAIINSTNLENGEQRFDEICNLAKKYGAALICLTIDEKGMALTKERKIEVANRMYKRATEVHNIDPSDLIFDLLTFSIGSGKDEYRESAKETLLSLTELSKIHSTCHTVLGVSNVSFGLSPKSRKYLNSVFLHHAVDVGLSMCIVDVKRILPYHKIDEQDRLICENLLFNVNDGNDPLMDFVDHFNDKTEDADHHQEELEKLNDREKVKQLIIDGDKSRIIPILKTLKDEMPAEKIISDILIEGMKEVGELFGRGELQLPFVLQSAEVMKESVHYLESFMKKTEGRSKTKIVLATVKGDVHDIGKNLVNIILTNNGFEVIDLGIKIDVERITEAVKEHNADAIGMSGLLVKSTAIMKENLEVLNQMNIDVPVLLGGAALTRNFVSDYCQAVYNGKVHYCRDAFDGLYTMNEIKDYTSVNRKPPKPFHSESKILKEKQISSEDIQLPSRKNSIPIPPFYGKKVIDIDIDTAFSWINEHVLFKGRWEYKQKNRSDEDYNKIVKDEVIPALNYWKRKIVEENIFQPTIIYGYWKCRSKGNQVILFDENRKELSTLTFPRQTIPPYRSIADYFHSDKDDVIGLSIVTIGQKFVDFEKKLYSDDNYKDYFLLHGLGVELAEGIAEYCHQIIRMELGINQADGKTKKELFRQQYQGSRYSFGYPACPDLEQNKTIIDLLGAGKYGISITEEYLMVPEQTTSAIICHHPEAKYFSINK